MVWHWIKISGQLHSDCFTLSERNLGTQQIDDSMGPKSWFQYGRISGSGVRLISFKGNWKLILSLMQN